MPGKLSTVKVWLVGLAAMGLGASATGAGAQPCELRWSDEFEVGADTSVYALEATPHGLYAGGSFRTIGGTAADRVARYEGGVWAPVGAGFTSPFAAVWTLRDVDLPFASGLLAGGVLDESGAAAGLWEGAAWRSLGDFFLFADCDPRPCFPSAEATAVFDDGRGPALYISGSFDEPAPGIVRWDGQWEGLGSGLSGIVGSTIGVGQALIAHDDGSGPALYVGGYLLRAGEVDVRSIARWRSTGWTEVGGGLGGPVHALAEFEIDGRPQIIAGLTHRDAGEVWRWDGAAWTRMGGAFNDSVYDLAVFDDGTGPALYAGGRFTRYNGQTLRGLARWDGTRWVEVSGGVGGSVYALEVQPFEGVQTLLAGGLFQTVGGIPSQNIARLIGCAPVCYADCDGSSTLEFLDFLCFQNAFSAQTSYADCDGSGSHDFFDFLCFQNHFVTGCP